MNPEILVSAGEHESPWYNNLEDSFEESFSSLNSPYHSNPSSQSSNSPSPGHETRTLSNRSAAAPARAVNIGCGIVYYGEVSQSKTTPSITTRQHSLPQSKLSRSNGGMPASYNHSHRRTTSVRDPEYHHNGHLHHSQLTQSLSSTSKRVHISNQTQTHCIPTRGSKGHSVTKKNDVSCYSAFGFGGSSKKSKEKHRLKLEKEKSSSKYGYPAHSVSHGTRVHPQYSHGYLSDSEGYRRAKKSSYREKKSKNHKQSSNGYSSDYEVVRHQKHKLQVERHVIGYSSGYETTGSFFSGSEWSEDEEIGHTKPDILSRHRSGHKKSAGKDMIHKLAKKLTKKSSKGPELADGGDGSWSKKSARKKKQLSNSLSNLADSDE